MTTDEASAAAAVTVQPQLLLERILSIEIVRVTERAAVSAARLRGRGAENGADGKAADNAGRHGTAAARLGGRRKDRRTHGRGRHQNDQTPGHD